MFKSIFKSIAISLLFFSSFSFADPPTLPPYLGLILQGNQAYVGAKFDYILENCQPIPSSIGHCELTQENGKAKLTFTDLKENGSSRIYANVSVKASYYAMGKLKTGTGRYNIIVASHQSGGINCSTDFNGYNTCAEGDLDGLYDIIDRIIFAPAIRFSIIFK